ncbi:glutathione synthase [Pleurotus eryngii]|uniref:Glutathione synthetase n=1 Tax=Pleurotus eryngii TaxID=5323 RepID=A0A9P6DBX8_PLEER|nr:glutathione synthase [Pleurotus eryngii]
MAEGFSFARWPPSLPDEKISHLTEIAATYALSHGLTYLPVGQQPRFPAAAIHAPLALFPSPIPRDLFQLAQRLQRIYNVLYARIAMDNDFLDQVMGAVEGVGKVDEFVGQLWSGWKQLRDEGVEQTLHLGLFRSDYLLHENADSTLGLKQVEFNTISSSFGTLSQRIASLHRYLLSATAYYGSSPILSADNLPANTTTAGLAAGLAAAHERFNNQSAWVLFVVQAGERNVFDQRWLEYELLEKHSIRVIRQTFDELATSARLDPQTSALRISRGDGLEVEISTVYFRAGYAPTDYPTPRHYQTRFLLERSSAVNCPSIPLQLAGGKKVQQVLAQPGILERFLGDSSKEDLHAIRGSWMGMWGLDLQGEEHTNETIEPLGVRMARERSMELVLKPQREGGGNNVYKEAISKFLDELPVSERKAWIAMELIVPPQGTANYLIRSGGAAVRMEVVSELGIFGWALFGSGEVVKDAEAGWLVRTKGVDSNEGGVATGYSVLDSIVLVDV